MFNIYYIQPSASITSSVTVVPDSSLTAFNPTTADINKPFFVYQDSTLEITASIYNTSESFSSTVDALRAYIRSGSITYASFPLEQINIFYDQQYLGNQNIKAPSNIPATSQIPLSSVSYFYSSNTGSIPTSPFSFKLYSASVDLINTSESFSYGNVILRTGDIYTAVISGSGNFYNLGISLYDSSTNTFEFSASSVNTPLSYSFSISNNTDSRVLFASASSPVGFSVLFDSPGDVPYTSSELNLWNTQFGISASYVTISGATASLFGGNLNTFTGSLSLFGLVANNIIPYSLEITSCSFAFSNTTTTTVPNINLSSPSLSNLRYFDMSYVGDSYSLTSGNFPSPSGSNIETYICSGNFNLVSRIDNLNLTSASALLYFESKNNSSLVGGTPDLSAFNVLSYIDSSICSLNGGINSLDGSYSLRTVNYNSNLLTGSIPSLSNLSNLTYFDVSYNRLSGSLPSLSNNTYLATFYFQDNTEISGSLPSLSNNTNLVNFNGSQTKVIGPLPDLSNNTKLSVFALNACRISGSIPSLDNNPLLFFYDVGGNNLTGSIPNLNNNPLLYHFNVATNKLSGSIPDLSNNGSLNQVYVHSNYLTSYTSSGISSTVDIFSAYNNLLDETSVDNILYDLDNAGRISGSVQLQGGSNSAPSALGDTYVSNLLSKGWTVIVN